MSSNFTLELTSFHLNYIHFGNLFASLLTLLCVIPMQYGTHLGAFKSNTLSFNSRRSILLHCINYNSL